ncbi:MAG: monovalent cation/H+ antiporter subunit D family protein [Bacillota bacterium]
MEETAALAVPIFAFLFPILMSPVIMAAGRRSAQLRNALALATTAAVFLAVVSLYPIMMRGEIIQFTLFEILPQLEISIRVDLLSFSLAALASFVWLLCTIYSIDYMAREHAGSRYYPVLIFTLGSCQGIFMAGDFFTLFIFFELMSLIAYILVIHEETPQALKAGYKYLIMTIIGGLALFFGIIITFELAGTVSLAAGPLVRETSLLAFLAFISFLIGFGMKAGIFPLHVWLPDAHPVAPSPASALLSGIMLKTGAYGLLRMIFHVFTIDVIRAGGWDKVMGVIAVITILLGSAVALTQDDIKRRLAYSSIGQMGYILLGMSVLNEKALIGDVFHIFSHAFMKSALFLAAGAIIWKTGKRLVSEMAGIGREMPFTVGCFSVAALAMIGVPPLNGFLSKWTLGLGALESGQPFYVFVLLVSSLLNALYYLPIIVPAFFGGLEHEHGSGFNIREATPRMVAPIVILALSTLLFGLLPTNIPFDLAQLTATFLLRGGP